MFSFKEQKIKNVFLIDNFFAEDERGIFVKTYHKDAFTNIGFNDTFKESYYSRSYQNVIRGMHFQTPPYDHEKMVYVIEGEIIDVILDLRHSSVTYGEFVVIKLYEFDQSLFIPKGCAHGFLTVSASATVVYNVTTVYNREADAGVLWNSFGFDWGINDPILSKRDGEFPEFATFQSAFE